MEGTPEDSPRSKLAKCLTLSLSKVKGECIEGRFQLTHGSRHCHPRCSRCPLLALLTKSEICHDTFSKRFVLIWGVGCIHGRSYDCRVLFCPLLKCKTTPKWEAFSIDVRCRHADASALTLPFLSPGIKLNN